MCSRVRSPSNANLMLVEAFCWFASTYDMPRRASVTTGFPCGISVQCATIQYNTLYNVCIGLQKYILRNIHLYEYTTYQVYLLLRSTSNSPFFLSRWSVYLCYL